MYHGTCEVLEDSTTTEFIRLRGEGSVTIGLDVINSKEGINIARMQCDAARRVATRFDSSRRMMASLDKRGQGEAEAEKALL